MHPALLLACALAVGAGCRRSTEAVRPLAPDRRAEVAGKWRWRGAPFPGDQDVVFDGKGTWTSRAVGEFGGYAGGWSLEGSALSIYVYVIDIMPGDPPNHWRFEMSADGRLLTSEGGKGGTLTKEPPKIRRSTALRTFTSAHPHAHGPEEPPWKRVGAVH